MTSRARNRALPSSSMMVMTSDSLDPILVFRPVTSDISSNSWTETTMSSNSLSIGPGPELPLSPTLSATSQTFDGYSPLGPTSTADSELPPTSTSEAIPIASSSYDTLTSFLPSLAPDTSSASSTAPSTAQTAAPVLQTDSSVRSSSRSRLGLIVGASGGAAALVCILLTLVIWRDKRRNRKKHSAETDTGKGLAHREADVAPKPAFVARHIEHSSSGDRETDATPDETGYTGDAGDPSDSRASCDTSSRSNRATLASDRTTVGGPHPPAYDRTRTTPPPLPPLPPTRPPQSPAPAFSTRRRQATDGGVRLAGHGTALHRSNSDADSSVDSLSTLPPPYEPHD